MSDYISREKLKSAYLEAHKGSPGRAFTLICEASAEDVAPVVHGHWIEAENGVCQCSICKNDPWWKDNCVNPFKNWNYCTNCGAKMNGGNTN